MCRIAGIISNNRADLDKVVRMRDSMLHGGPDDFGTFVDESLNLAFGFRRLSFLDLSPLGHQPMLDETGNVIIIFNGEIYNFQSIKNELVGKGYQFRSTGDTEVILYAYIEWGEACFSKFNGMFAIVILDKRRNTLLFARDHAGIKPLYYFHQDKTIYFASEVRAFKEINPAWPENPDWRKYFLLFGHLPEPVTTLKDVKPLPKGTWLEIDLTTFKTRQQKFFSLYFNYTITNRAEAIRKVKAKLQESVERHLISDAPVGLFLSGGLDSSLLTLIASKIIPNNLQTLSIIFEDEKFSEKKYQDIIINKTNARHRSYQVSKEVFNESLPDIIKAMDQPSNDGINSYFISKYAHEFGIKAALSGIGADELFGGYPSFYRTKVLQKSKFIPAFMFAVAGIASDKRLKRVSFLKLKNGLGDYLFNRGMFTPGEVAALLDCSVQEVEKLIEDLREQFPIHVKKLLPLEQVSFTEANLYMQNQLLKDTDYMSMWHSLEVRVPFLDKELIELVYSISPDIRYDSKQYKALLIDAFRDLLPSEIWQRPKQGFSFPFGAWMTNATLPFENEKTNRLKTDLIHNKIHWSRYWSFALSQLQK